MSLRTKILLILALVVSVFSIGDNLIQRQMIGESFRELEEREAEKDLQRVVRALESEQQALERRARDWAETSAVQDICAGLEDRDLLDGAANGGLMEHNLNLVYVCSPSGEVLWSRIEVDKSGDTITLRDMPQGYLPPQHRLIKSMESQDSISGLLMTEQGALLLGSRVVRSPDTGELTGTLILGRFLNKGGLLDSLGSREQVAFSVWSVSAAQLPTDKPGLLDKITSAPGSVLDYSPSGQLQIYTTIRDLKKAPSILVRADIEPEITRRGERSVNYALLSTVGTGLLIMFVLVRVLTRIVIGPLAKLTHAATQIGQTDDTSLRTGFCRQDEIGQLSTEFDNMLEKLETSKHEVIRTSRLAGMSEIATGVLHNVGNVLNSVNVSANLVTRKAEQLRVDDLAAMHAILREHEDDLGEFVENHPQGKHLLPFLDELARALQSSKDGILEELGGMNRGVEHIGELVRSQQSLAGRQGVLEPTDLAEQLDAAVVICQQAGKGKSVKVVREYADLGRLEVDRHKLMEILVNLIKNAFGAMEGLEIQRRSLTLTLEKAGQDRIKIYVKDTGKGIPDENLARIFKHGFTTSDDGHGFGLHVSANAATEMKGSLVAESEGLGKGATFVLDLKAKEARVAQAA